MSKKMHKMSKEEILDNIGKELPLHTSNEIEVVLNVFLRQLKKLDVKEAETYSPFGERVYTICRTFEENDNE